MNILNLFDIITITLVFFKNVSELGGKNLLSDFPHINRYTKKTVGFFSFDEAKLHHVFDKTHLISEMHIKINRTEIKKRK